MRQYILCVFFLLVIGYCSAVTVWTRSYNNHRTNAQLEETKLNTNNVNSKTFGKLFSRDVVGHVYAQTLYVPNLVMAVDGKVHNVMFVVTMGNNVYAFDADDPNASDPLWMKNFGPTLPIDEQAKWFEHSDHCATYTDILIEVGILSTPVIDTATNLMYFVATNKDADEPYTIHHRIYAVDIRSGETKLGPTIIDASVPGTGIDNVNGVINFNPKKQSQRQALSLVGNMIYLGFGSYCTAPPYHGWLFGFDKNTLQRTFYFCSTPDGEQGSIWHSGQGMVWDDAGYMYGISTNGVFKEGTDWANSFLKIDPNKKTASGMAQNAVVDYFTPYNWHDLYVYDLDLGTAGPLYIPGTNLLLGCGKQGWCYVVDTNNLGKYSGKTGVNNCWQYFQANKNFVEDPNQYPYLRMGVHTSPTTWTSPAIGSKVYIWPVADQLKSLHLDATTKKFDLTKTQTGKVGLGTESDPEVLFPGGAIALSANGDQAGTGIVWASHAMDGSANRYVRHGVLRAFDAADVTKELWNSTQIPCRDKVGWYSKFLPPMIADGKVFIGTFSKVPDRAAQVHVYGLLSAEQQQQKWTYDPCCVLNGCEQECCMGMCYDPKVLTCTNNMLCTVGSKACGQACYDPKVYACTAGVLYPIGTNPPPPAPSSSPVPQTSNSPAPQSSDSSNPGLSDTPNENSQPVDQTGAGSSAETSTPAGRDSSSASAVGTTLFTLALIAVLYYVSGYLHFNQ
jgi:hypothetical protein